MAGRNFTPVMFALEKNTVQIYGRILIGSGGVPILDTNNSKGICAVGLNAVNFTGFSTNSTTTIGTVSSFAGLFSGMTVTGSAGALQATTVIGSASSLILNFSKQSIQTGGPVNFSAVGGQYIFQFGSQAGVRLDGYNKLLAFDYSWDESTSSASGSALQSALAPGATNAFVVSNSVSTRTVPPTITTNSTDCSVVVQLGVGAGVGFSAVAPSAGEVLKVNFVLGNSSAI